MAQIVSNPFKISIVRDTHLGQMTASFLSGWSDPLDIPTLGTQTYDSWQSSYQSYPDEVNIITDNPNNPEDQTGAIKTKRNWHWQSKWCWDPTTHRIMAIHSPHIETDNLNATQLTVYDEETNEIWTYQNPIMRTVGHGFDCNCIDVENRILYKWTQPAYEADAYPYITPYQTLSSVDVNTGNPGYFQPQLCGIDIDLITSSRNSVEQGAAAIPEVPRNPRTDPATPATDLMRDVTAPGMDFWPGKGIYLYHNERLWFNPLVGSAWTYQPVTVNKTGTGNVLHTITHYNPNGDHLILGGGSYDGVPGSRNVAFHMLNASGQLVRLDDSPTIMSVNSDGDTETKCCSTFIPGTKKSVFFHNDRNIYVLDPYAASGNQWTVLTGEMDPDNPVNPNTGTINNDRWCCAIPEYGCIAVGHFGWYGTSRIRLWKY